MKTAMETIENTCEACGHGSALLWAKKNGYRAYQCPRCGYVYTWPVPTEAELKGAYDREYFSTHYDPRAEQRDEGFRKRLVQYRLDVQYIGQFCLEGTVLDFGCGNGKYLECMPSSFTKIGFDFNPAAHEYLNSTNIGTFYTGDALSMPLVSNSLDLVTMRGVLEHIPNPREVVAFLTRALKHGGHFVFTSTPSADGPCAEVYRERWNQFEPPYHLNFHTLRSLSLMLSGFGLVPIDARYPYIETPYADFEADSARWLAASGARSKDATADEESPAFTGNLMSAAFRKA